MNACIDLDWHSKEAALSAAPGSETVAGDTSQACGAGRITLGVLTDVQRELYHRGCPGGPHKTFSTFYGCRGGDCGCSGRDKMMSPGGAALEGCPLQCSALQNAQEGRILLELFPKAAVRVGRAAELVAGSARHAMHARARGGWCWVC